MSEIFNKIVKDGNPKEDLVGILAFSIHKIHEIEFIKNYEEKNGKKPSKQAMEQFRMNAEGVQNLSSYRRDAGEMLEEIIQLAIAEKTKEIKSVLPERITVQNNIEEKSFFYGVWQSVVGSFIFVLLTGLLVFFVWSSKKGIGEVIQEIFFQEEYIPNPKDNDDKSKEAQIQNKN